MSFITMLLTGVFSKETANFRGEVKQTERVHADPYYRITHYDAFFNQCASIQTLTTQVQNAQTDYDTAPDTASRRDAQLRLIGARNQRVAAINQYNADAGKEDTAANFLSSNLPYHIDPNAEVVQCAA